MPEFVSLATMEVEPVAMVVVKPASLIVATDVADELQFTNVVKFFVLLSEYVPVAVNCCEVPLAMLGLEGVTAMDTRVADVTVTDVTVMVVVPEIVPDVAVI